MLSVLYRPIYMLSGLYGLYMCVRAYRAHITLITHIYAYVCVILVIRAYICVIRAIRAIHVSLGL